MIARTVELIARAGQTPWRSMGSGLRGTRARFDSGDVVTGLLILGGVIQSAEHDSVPVVLICRSGNRSDEAGKLLIEHGFKHVYNIVHGFEGELDDDHHRSTVTGWRFDGLPWEQC